MKTIHYSLFLICMMILNNVAQAKVSVFFLGGQSNVSPGWCEGIKETIKKSGQYEEPLFVIVAHPGRQSDMWVNKNPGNYYLTDFFAEDGTGALQKALADLKKQNKEYSFEGLFWFQGEASEDRNATEKWKNNLLGMIASIRKDLGDSHWKYVVSVIDINPAFTTPADTANTNALREVMLALPSVDPKAIAADSRGYERVDAWHLKRETGAREFGAAAAKAFLTSVRDANK